MMRCCLVLAGLLLCSCVGPRRDATPDPASAPAWRAEFAEHAADPTTRLAWLDERLERASSPRERAELELERARAFQDLGRSLSAKTSLMRAWADVSPSVAGVGGEIQLAWAESEYRSGERLAARKRWEELLGKPGLLRVHAEQAWAALSVVCDAAGEAAAAKAWRMRLGPRGDRSVAAAKSRLVREVAAPVVARRVAGSIPSDPRSFDPALHLRGAWRARPMRSNYTSMEPIHAITVHHTAMVSPAPGHAPEMLREIQAMHQDDEGWADIGYHFLIDPGGEVWEGRPLAAQGAHAGNSESNRGNIGVCLMGNFETQTVPAGQAAALVRLLDTLREHFGLDRSAVQPHSRYRSTACPGRYLAAIVGNYRGG